MKQDLAHGHGIGFSLFGGQGVTNSDKQAILNFNQAIQKGIPKQKAWATTMSKASIAAQNMTRNALKTKASLVDLANGLKVTSVKAKAAEIGFKALSVASNMLLSIGISMAISAIISGLESLANAQENAIEKANEFIDKFEEQRDALKSNKESIDSMSEDYERLANGVDSLGRNVSLNSNEYARYNEIVNQIADMFPKMVQGYTDEGNAIIAHKGKVEELTKAYEEQKKAAQDALIIGANSAYKGYKSKVDYNASTWTWEESGLLQMKDLAEKILSAQGDASKIKTILKKSVHEDSTYASRDLLKKAGLDPGFFYENVDSADYYIKHMDSIKAALSVINSEIEAETSKIRPIMQAYLDQSYSYQGLDEDVQDIVKQIVGQFDSEFYAQFDDESDMATWVTENIVNKFKGKDGEKMAVEFGAMFDLHTQFNNGDVTVAEYQKQLSEFLKTIGGLPEEVQRNIKIIFGITSPMDGFDTSKSDITYSDGQWWLNKKDGDGNYGGSIGIGNKAGRASATVTYSDGQYWINSYDDKGNYIGSDPLQTNSSTDTLLNNVKNKFGDKYKEYEDEIHQLELDELETLSNLDISPEGIESWSEVETLIANTGKEIDKTTASLTELEKASDNIKPLGNAFKELSDDGYITIKTLKEMQAASDLSGEEWAEYEAKLLKAKVGSSEFNQVMSDLTYKILDNTFANVDLTDTTEQQIIAVLRENGVVNASAVAHDWLAKAKAKEKIASMELVKGSKLDIVALTSEAAACGVAKNAYLELVAKEIVFNRNDLDVEDKIEKLNQIAVAAGVAGINMDVLNNKFSSDKEKTKYLLEKGFTITTTTSESPSSTNNWVTGNGFFGDKSTFSAPSTQGIELTSPDGTKYSSLDEATYNEYAMDQIGGLMERISGATGNITIPNYSGSVTDPGSDKNDALDNYLKDAENRYKIHQDETKYIQDLQYAYDNLTKSEKERLDITGKINEAYRDLADNKIKDIKHQIDLSKELSGDDVDVTSYYDQIQTVASEEATRLRNIGYDDNSNEIQDLQKTWWDAQNSKLDFYTKQHENIIRDIEHARDMSLEKNPFVDTRSFYSQMQEEYHTEADRLRSLDPEKYKEEIQEYQKKWWDAEQSKVDWQWENSNNWINDRNTYNDWDLFGDSEVEAWERVIKWLNKDYPQELDKIKEAEANLFNARKRLVDDLLTEIQDETNKTYDIRISRLNSQSSLLSKHFGLVNSITEEQHTLNKELKEAETIGAKMNEQERKTLFNKEDHVRLSGKLNDIMLDITDLQGDYIRDLETATEDTIEGITNQYERQYDLKMKEYEIVKAELSVMKAQQVLENTENEKSVRTWSGSGWVYQANLQDVLKAQEELEDAKYAVTKAKTDEAQQKAINAIEANADALQTEKNKLTSAIEDMAEKMEGSGKDITSMLSTIAKTDLPTFDAIINTLGSSIKKALGMSDDDINKVRFEGSSGLQYEYAYGTKRANNGVGLFDENGFGSELILTNGGILTQFNGGERVFSSDMADRLWEFSKNGGIFSHTLQQISSGKLLPIEDKISNIISNMSNISGDTYMIKDVQLSESEGGTLKGFIDFLKKKV